MGVVITGASAPVVVTTVPDDFDLTLDGGTLAVNASATGTASVYGKTITILDVVTSRPARVRIYTSQADRDSDLTRTIGTDPTGSVATSLKLEMVTVALALGIETAPVPTLFALGGALTSDFYWSIVNTGTATGSTIAVVTVHRVFA